MKNGKPVSESIQEYIRGIAGGLLFSFPLLYTMEVWQKGFSAKPISLLLLMIGTGLLLLGYNRFAGMHPDATWRAVAIDSVEEMGIGLLLSFLVLMMLNRIHLGSMGPHEIMGKVLIEAMAVSIGVSIGTAQLGVENGGGNKEATDVRRERRRRTGVATLGFCGAVIVGGNVAPTEEILIIAMESTPVHILFMFLASLFISVTVVYYARFRGSKSYADVVAYDLVFDTCLCYLVALLASAFFLWFFGRFNGAAFQLALSQCIVLGVLSSLGSSAGRLLIK